MKNLKITLLSTFITSVLFIAPLVSFAAITDPTPVGFKIDVPNPLKICEGVDIQKGVGVGTCSIPGLLKVIIEEIITPIAAVVLVIMMMYGGFTYVTANGNQTQLTKAKDIVLYSAIGGAILLGANLLASVVIDTVKQLKI